MDPLAIATILLGIGLTLLLAEMLLPSHGLLGVLACLAFGGTVFYCFKAGPVLGAGVLAIMVVASPFVFMWMMRMWPKTPVGKRIVLDATVPRPPQAPKIAVGEQGRTVTDLRPSGECDFGEDRVDVISEYGLIDAGTVVTVVGHEGDARPVVRVLGKSV